MGPRRLPSALACCLQSERKLVPLWRARYAIRDEVRLVPYSQLSVLTCAIDYTFKLKTHLVLVIHKTPVKPSTSLSGTTREPTNPPSPPTPSTSSFRDTFYTRGTRGYSVFHPGHPGEGTFSSVLRTGTHPFQNYRTLTPHTSHLTSSGYTRVPGCYPGCYRGRLPGYPPKITENTWEYSRFFP